MYKLGVIGVGNMGGAIIRGILNSNTIDPKDIIIFERNKDKVSDLIEKKVTLASSEEELISKTDKVLLAIRPQGFKNLSLKIRNSIKKNSLIISIAAGVSIKDMNELFGDSNKYIRVMSNTPAIVKEGMTAISLDENIDQNYIDFAIQIFESVGKVIIIEEEKIPAFTGFVGCMPAYIFMLIESASDAAVSHGFSRKEIYQLMSQVLLGSAKLVQETGKHPAELKDEVTSPGGSTIKGVLVLEKSGFRNAIIEAVHEGTKSSEKLI